ncbi:MAG: hypothetical protein EP346_00085 [Bacteroidetes bacterium]|nr:MAG: hypothetical protein EP346_00085 [Bacteroidota bacterium]
MARTIVDEELKYTVIINGNKAQKELFDLEKTQRSLEASNKSLREAKAKLISQGKKESQEYKRLTSELRSNNKALVKNKARQAELRKELGLNALTMKQLRDEAKRLRLQLDNMTPGSKEFIQLDAQLKKVNARVRELRRQGNRTQAVLGRFSSIFSSVTSKGLGFLAMITGAVYSLNELLTKTSELSDAQADVIKTTGLTNDELNELQSNLDNIDTRSSRIELLGLAEEAGRLGKRGVNNISDFVEVADKIKVALGDDLSGDTNENIRLIGKLTEQYEVGTNAGLSFSDGMTMVGSAINEVSASGTAQADFIVDYMKRLVGVSRQTRMTADETIGFAAVLDEAGQSVEVSGTAISKLVMDMAKDLDTYSKIAGRDPEEFRRIFNEDTNEALLLFLEGLNGNNEGLEELSKKLDSLGVDGARASSVLATLASNTEAVRNKQEIANQSLHEATSLTDEFTRKNENYAAVLNKISKETLRRIVDSRFVGWLKDAIIFLGKMVGVVEDADGSIDRFKERVYQLGRILIVATAALLSHKLALQLVTVWGKRAAVAESLLNLQLRIAAIRLKSIRALSLLAAASKALFTGNVTRARTAMKLFNATVKANPIGLIITLLGTAYAAWKMYGNELSNAEKAQRNIANIQAQAEKNIANEITKVNLLVEAAKNDRLSKEDRIKAINELNRISPEYLGGLTLEKIGHLESKKAIDDYVESLRKKAIAEALQSKRAELYRSLIEKQNVALEDSGGLISWIADIGFAGSGAINALEFTDQQKDIEAIQLQINALDEYQSKLLETGEINLNDVLTTTATEPSITNSGGGELDKTRLEALKELRAEIAQNLHEMELLRLNSDERELQIVRDKYNEMRKVTGIGEAELRQIAELENSELTMVRIKQEENRQKLLIDTKKKFNLLSRDELMELELQELREAHANELVTEEEFQTAKTELMSRYQRERDEELYNAKKEYGLVTAEEELTLELDRLASQYELKLLSEEQFQQAKAQIEKRYQLERYQRYVDEINFYNSAIQQMGNALAGFKEAELNRIEEVQRKGDESEESYTARKEEEEAKRKEVAKKYASSELLMKSSQILASTATAIMAAWESGPLVGAIMTPIIAANGTAQYAAAKAEYDKIQGYEEGYYPVMDQHGRKFNAQRVNNPGTRMLNDPTILAGEKPELIIDPKTTKYLQVNAPGIIDTIYAAANRVKGVNTSSKSNAQSSPASFTQRSGTELTDTMLVNTILKLLDRLDQPIFALVGDDQAKNIEFLRGKYNEILENSRLSVKRG